MNKLKHKVKITCNTCGCSLKRTKAFKVVSDNKDEAVKEVQDLINSWRKNLDSVNCKICQSIIDEMYQPPLKGEING
jgi:hypothetical protein